MWVWGKDLDKMEGTPAVQGVMLYVPVALMHAILLNFSGLLNPVAQGEEKRNVVPENLNGSSL